jgi:hypothetical protein
MKNDVMPSIVQMGKDELKVLLTEVKETVATDFVMPETSKKQSFSAAELWNIRRNARSASDRMRKY